MADYISTLNGQQMDSALMDMAEHTSEAYAVGERNGIPVGEGDVAYENNARYYAQIATSTVPAGDIGDAVRWGVDQSTVLTDANKAQARSNIDAGKNGAWSNRNLLDNAYFVGGGSQLGDGVFPINQRGQSSYSGAGVTTFDRWICDYNVTATLQSGGVRVQISALYSGLTQVIPAYKMKDGETYTFSIIVDGTLHSATFTAHDDGSWYNILFGDDWYVPYQFINGNWYFKALNAMNVDAFDHLVSAVKLEKGTVSTLANDVPPNYWLELQKCKARLRFVPLTRCPIVFAAGNAYLDLNGCEMEGAPTAALYSNAGAVVGSSGASSAITSVTFIGIGHNVPLLQFNLASAINDQVGQIYNTVVQLSSEL